MRPTLTSNMRVAPDTRGVGQAFNKTLGDLSRIEQMRLQDEQQKVDQYEKTLSKSYQEVADRDRDEFIQKRQQFEDNLNEIYRKTGGELSYDDQRKINAMTQDIDDFVGTSQELQEDYKAQMKELAQNPDKYDIERTKENLSQIMDRKLKDRAEQWYGYDWMEQNVEKPDMIDIIKKGQQVVKEKEARITPQGKVDAAGNQTYRTDKFRSDEEVMNYAKEAFKQNEEGFKRHLGINSAEQLYEQIKPHLRGSSEFDLRKSSQGSSRYGAKDDGSFSAFPTEEEGIPITKEGDKTGTIQSLTTVPGQGVENFEYKGKKLDIENAKVLPVLRNPVWVSKDGTDVQMVNEKYPYDQKKKKDGYILKEAGELITKEEANQLRPDNLEYKPYVFFQIPKEENNENVKDQQISQAKRLGSALAGTGLEGQAKIYYNGDQKLAYVPYRKNSDLRVGLRDHKDWGAEKDDYLFGFTNQVNNKKPKSVLFKEKSMNK